MDLLTLQVYIIKAGQKKKPSQPMKIMNVLMI